MRISNICMHNLYLNFINAVHSCEVDEVRTGKLIVVAPLMTGHIVIVSRVILDWEPQRQSIPWQLECTMEERLWEHCQ